MKLKKHPTSFFIMSAIILTLSLFVSSCTQSSDNLTLTFASFRAENDYWVPAFKEWARDFEQKTNGKCRIEMNWGGGMGASKDYYNMLSSGVFDLANWQPTLLPGRFPVSELMTLPIEAPSISAPTMAFHALYKKGYLDKEYSDAKILFVWAGAGNLIAQNKRSASTLAEMQGIRIGNSGGYAIEVLKAANAVPVNMSLGERYISIERGVIDGSMGTWASIYTAKFYEIVHFATEPGMCSFPFVMLMNRRTYDRLPPDVKAVVDEMSLSEKYARLIGKLGDANLEQGKSAFLANGGTISHWDPADFARIGSDLAPFWEKALSDTEEKGYPARQAVHELYVVMKQLGIEQPFVGYTPDASR